MPPLHFVAVDLKGDPTGRGSIIEYDAGIVTIPLSDRRTGSITVRMENPASEYFGCGTMALKAVYGDALIMHAIVTKPVDDFAAGTVTANALDPTVRLEHRAFRYGHSSVVASTAPNPGIPLDGTGFRMPITDAAGGGTIPHTHITAGTDTVPAQPAPGSGGLYVQVSRGQTMWDAVNQMTQAASGFDVDWAPIDADHPGAGWVAGDMVEARTVPVQGTDRRTTNILGNKPVTFVHGIECSIVSEPDAEHTVNYAVKVIPGGQSGSTDTGSKAGAYNRASWVAIGIWEQWESVGDNLDPAVRQAVLKDRALAQVQAYGTPPAYVTVTLAPTNPLRFPADVNVGDLVGVYARRGFRTFAADVRITQVTITGAGTADAQVQFLCVPFADTLATIIFDDTPGD